MKTALAEAWESSWARFTSWWVYPMTLIVAIRLVALSVAGVADPVPYVAFRLLGFGAVMAWLYDVSVRKRGLRKRQGQRR